MFLLMALGHADHLEGVSQKHPYSATKPVLPSTANPRHVPPKVTNEWRGPRKTAGKIRPIIYMHGIFNKADESDFAAKYIPEVNKIKLVLSLFLKSCAIGNICIKGAVIVGIRLRPRPTIIGLLVA